MVPDFLADEHHVQDHEEGRCYSDLVSLVRVCTLRGLSPVLHSVQQRNLPGTTPPPTALAKTRNAHIVVRSKGASN